MTPFHKSRSTGSARFEFLDAARGGAMFFVLMSHFAWVFLRSPDQQTVRDVLINVGMIATPTFVILSGLLLGVLFQRSGDAFGRIQAKLIDRGLFLLVVGHFLIAIAAFLSAHSWAWSFSTDAIGAAMVIGAIAIPHLGRRSRLAVAVLAYVASWMIVYDFVPRESHIEALREVLFGSLNPSVFTSGTFPIVPWTAVYLASTVLGERIAALLGRGASQRAALELTGLGSSGIGSMTFIKIVAFCAGVAPLRHVSFALLRVGNKYPPGPMYLLFYGGIGLLFLTGWLLADGSESGKIILPKVAAWGQSSLFVFITHFYLYWLGLWHLAPGGVLVGSFYFVVSTALLFALAREWHRHGCNRFLTVGYEAMWRTTLRQPVFTT